MQEPNWTKVVILSIIAIILLIVLSVAGCAGCKSFNRAQARADAANRVRVTQTNIRRERAQVAVIQQQAAQRVAQAIGIRGAQDHIAKTLTPLYVQWEAIQAQLAMANSQNHTMIWAPTGANGVPLVSTVQLQNINALPGGK